MGNWTQNNADRHRGTKFIVASSMCAYYQASVTPMIGCSPFSPHPPTRPAAPSSDHPPPPHRLFCLPITPHPPPPPPPPTSLAVLPSDPTLTGYYPFRPPSHLTGCSPFWPSPHLTGCSHFRPLSHCTGCSPFRPPPPLPLAGHVASCSVSLPQHRPSQLRSKLRNVRFWKRGDGDAGEKYEVSVESAGVSSA